MPVRTWAKSDDGKIHWVTMTAKYLPGALEVIRKSFNVNESLSTVIQMSKTKKGQDQFDEVLEVIAQDGVSVVAVEVATDKVVGCGFNKLAVKGSTEETILEKFGNRPENDPAFKEIMDFMKEVESKMDIFKHYGIDCFLDHMFLATHPEYYRKKVGLNIVASTVEMAKALSRGEDVAVPISQEKFPWKTTPVPRPKAVIALFTSPKSQGIGKKLGFEEVYTADYNEFFYQGKSYASRLDKDNWCTKFVAYKFGK